MDDNGSASHSLCRDRINLNCLMEGQLLVSNWLLVFY